MIDGVPQQAGVHGGLSDVEASIADSQEHSNVCRIARLTSFHDV
jgi:hypothetical protein